MKAVILLGAGALALSACSAKMDDQTRPSKAPAARVVGEARSCLPINQVSQSRVHDDRTIDFRVGSRTYRNTLPQSCPSLGFEEAFTYSTSLSQLCSTDIITVVLQGGGPRLGASCGLGTFAPHTPIKGE